MKVLKTRVIEFVGYVVTLTLSKDALGYQKERHVSPKGSFFASVQKSGHLPRSMKKTAKLLYSQELRALKAQARIEKDHQI